MPEETIPDILLCDPLRQVTRKQRTYLLGSSAFGIMVVKTGLVPSKISALGIEFAQTDQKGSGLDDCRRRLVFLFSVYLLCLLGLPCLWSDFLKAKRFLKAEHRTRYEELRENELRAEQGNLFSEEGPGQIGPPIEAALIRSQMVELHGEFADRIQGIGIVRWLLNPTWTLRLLFDFILPSSVGAYAFWVLSTWIAPIVINVK